MATAKRFSIYPCSFVHAGGTLNLAQMQGFDSRPEATIRIVYVGGAVDPKANIAVMANPKVTFGTRDITTLIGTLNPLTGLKLAAGGAIFRLQERDDGESIFLTAATHETHDVAKGHIVLDSIGAAQDDQEGAIAQLTCHALYDGTNEPIVHNTGIDFSDGEPTPAFSSEFFMGPVYHNGAQIEGVTRWSVETGLAFVPFRTDGNVYPGLGYIARRTPKIKVTTLKVDTVASLNKTLRALSGTFACYLWKGTNAGSRVAVATGAHFKVSAAAGAWRDESLSVTENDDGTATIEVLATGTLGYSITSAIP
jgi:hypothetical protein